MTEQKPIRVLLVDDHAMVRLGLRNFLRAFSDLELIGEAAGGEEALAPSVSDVAPTPLTRVPRQQTPQYARWPTWKPLE